MIILQGHRLNTENKEDRQKQDADLVALICKADEQAFELLYHRFYNRLFRFIARITRRTDLIDEVINDAMYVVWEKAGTYNRQCLVSTWIFGIAFNKARQSLRYNSQADQESLDEMDADSLLLAEIDPGPKQLEMDDWLESAFDGLSAEQRAVIELTYYEGLHYSEIAELMGCSENTVKTRMHYARKKLAILLKQNK
jgi:RNA polymerase sigma-70 factor (ECF subfamily)